MSFIRSFDIEKIKRMTGESAEILARLNADVLSGEVFPTVRKDELHFYYEGGCLYKFTGNQFERNKKYEKYSEDTSGLSPYDKAKKQNENRHTKKTKNKSISMPGVADTLATERRLLDRLNNHTFCIGKKTQSVVLDIEVNLNGSIGGGKKCDMVLLNTETGEVMFVEGKVFSDNRVNRTAGNSPEVIEQVEIYTAAIEEQAENILVQYCEHIRIINMIFGTAYKPPVKLIATAKLLVFETPTKEKRTKNGHYVIETISKKLGANNVAWYATGDDPTIDEIWGALCK